MISEQRKKTFLYLKYFYLLTGIALLLGSCVSLVENTGRLLDGTAARNRRTALYRASLDSSDTNFEVSIIDVKKTNLSRNRIAGKSLLISITKYPMMKIRASYPDDKGNIHLISLEYLGGSAHGWNEYAIELAGEGSFIYGMIAFFEITTDIEPVQINSASILRYESRITGDEALTNMQNRSNRIAALTEWMALQNVSAGKGIDEFDKYWKPILFPELVSKRKKPAGWLQEGDKFIRAEDVRWNTSYTERVFSEELIPVRDSGTMLRDWEEALPWIYMEYYWDEITDLLSSQIRLIKIK